MKPILVAVVVAAVAAGSSFAKPAAPAMAPAKAHPASHSGAGHALSVIKHIPGPDGGWDYAAYDPEHGRILVGRTDGTLAIDGKTGAITPAWVPGKRLHASIAIPGGLGLNTNGGDNSATIFDSATGKILGTVPTGINPDAAAYDPHSGNVYVMNGRGGDITVIDPKAMKVVGTIMVGGKLEFGVADGKGKMFVNVEDKNEIAVIDTASLRLVARHALKDCDGPSGLAFVAKHGVLVTVCDSHADVVSAATGKVLQVLDIGKGPDAAMYDPKRDQVFVPCGQDGRLDVISFGAKGASVTGHIATARGARTGAIDTATGHIYLPTAKYAPPAEPGKRPTVVPGSFEVLVVG